MMDSLLLDTCAVIWLMNRNEIDEDARGRINRAAGQERVFVSPYTAWELAMLNRKGRIDLTMSVDDWFNAVLEFPGVSLAAMPPRVLIASVQLPGTPPNDPADRVIIATARAYNMSVVTRDLKILDYGRSGNVRVLAC